MNSTGNGSIASVGARSGGRRLDVERQQHIRDKTNRDRRESSGDQPHTVSKQRFASRPLTPYRYIPSTPPPQGSNGNQHPNAANLDRLRRLRTRGSAVSMRDSREGESHRFRIRKVSSFAAREVFS